MTKRITFPTIMVLVLIILGCFLFAPKAVYGQEATQQESSTPQLQEAVDTNREEVLDCNGDASQGGNLQKCLSENPIVKLVQVLVNFLAAGAGIIIVIMIAVGGLQYSAAGNDPQKLSAAKMRILNALIALVCLMFLYAFLQWLVPGGVF